MTINSARPRTSKKAAATQPSTPALNPLTQAQLDAASEALHRIINSDLAAASLTILLAATYSKDDRPDYRRVSIAQDTVPPFRQTIQNVLEPLKAGLSEGHIAVEEFTVEPVDAERTIEYLDLAQPEFAAIREQLQPLKDDYQDLQTFVQNDRHYIDGLRFYTMRVLAPTLPDPLFFFRHYNPSQLLSESTLFGISWHHNFYNHIADPTLLFDRFIDCFCYQQHFFILRKDDFYKDFRYMDAIEEAARQTLEQLEQMELIANFPDFSGGKRPRLPFHHPLGKGCLTSAQKIPSRIINAAPMFDNQLFDSPMW